MKWNFHQPQSGTSADFDGLLRPHLPRLFRLAFRFTQSESDAEDLVQELLVKMLPPMQPSKKPTHQNNKL